MKLTLLIDGKYFMYRSVNVNQVLSYNDIRTGLYYTFLRSMLTMMKKLTPDNIIIMWDSIHYGRKDIYPFYKAKDNKNIDIHILEQLKNISMEYDNIKIILKKLGFASYKRFSLEADDLFWYYINSFPNEKIIIASKDEDLYQLISDKVTIYDPGKKILKNYKWFKKTYDIEPSDWWKVKKYAGCSSDNVPGIPGVGEKTAIKIIKGQIDISKYVEKEEYKQKYEFTNHMMANESLVKLPYPFKKIKPLKLKRTILDIDELINFFVDFGFKSFLNEIDEWKNNFPLKRKANGEKKKITSRGTNT